MNKIVKVLTEVAKPGFFEKAGVWIKANPVTTALIVVVAGLGIAVLVLNNKKQNKKKKRK